jgi:hypothetical protein
MFMKCHNETLYNHHKQNVFFLKKKEGQEGETGPVQKLVPVGGGKHREG